MRVVHREPRSTSGQGSRFSDKFESPGPMAHIREYSLSGDGTVDYKTARQIILSYYNEYWNSVVETKEFPLFYWHDANHDGDFEMWVDRQVEGCPCDIHRYEPMEEPETVLSHLPNLPPGGSP